MRSLLTGAFICCATLAQGATVNGDFSAGLSGYALDACGFACGRPTDPFFGIQSNGGDPYLSVSTSTSLLGVTQASATQDITVTADTRYLSFDAIGFPSVNDPGSGGSGPFFDAISILVVDESSNFHFIFDILDGALAFNPFSNPLLSVLETTASDPFFAAGVEADLGAFMGQTLSFGIFAFSESDGSTLTGAFDNFELSGTSVTAVPLPASLPLLLGAFALLGVARRRQQD